MRIVTASAALFALTILTACSPRDEAPAATDPGASEKPAPAAPTAQSGRPLGDGRSMTGAVSGLTGLVTAFQVEETATQIVVELAADVLFAFDQATLSPQAPEQLQKTVAQIARGGGGTIAVVGHTDGMGDDAYNDALSLRRAQAVVEWLATEGGVDRARLKAEGRGEREPVAANERGGQDDPEGRARNRRVTVVIPKA